MRISINSDQLSKFNRMFGISPDESSAAAARFRAGIDPVQHSQAMAAEKARSAPESDTSGQPFPEGPSRGPTKLFPSKQASRPFPDAGDQVARAKNHIEAFEDEDDEMPKHERLSRAADLLKSAAESMRPKSGEQHFSRR